MPKPEQKLYQPIPLVDRTKELEAICFFFATVSSKPRDWPVNCILGGTQASTPTNVARKFQSRLLRDYLGEGGVQETTTIKDLKEARKVPSEASARTVHLLLRMAGLGGLSFVREAGPDGQPFLPGRLSDIAWRLRAVREHFYLKNKELLNAGRPPSQHRDRNAQNPFNLKRFAQHIGVAESTYPKFEGILDVVAYGNKVNPDLGRHYRENTPLERGMYRNWQKMSLVDLDRAAQALGLGGLTVQVRPGIDHPLFVPHIFPRAELAARWPERYGPGKSNPWLSDGVAGVEHPYVAGLDPLYRPGEVAKATRRPLLDAHAMGDMYVGDEHISLLAHPMAAQAWVPPTPPKLDDGEED